MNSILHRSSMILLLSSAVIGCAIVDPQRPAISSVTIGSSPYMRGDLGTLTYRAVDLMLASAPEVTPATPIIVVSIADAQNVDTTTPLGNIMADMIRTRIAQRGHTVSEIRLRSAISFNKGEGEFLLSRNRHALMPAPNAGAIVMGTYATSYSSVYVSVKIISAMDARIIAGADFVVPLRDAGGLMLSSEEH